jgi:hypothetical protein
VPEGRSLDIERHGTAITLHWLGILNAPYEAQARNDLARDGWSLLDTVIGADGPTAYTVPTGDSRARFFSRSVPHPTVAAATCIIDSNAKRDDSLPLLYYTRRPDTVAAFLLSNTFSATRRSCAQVCRQTSCRRHDIRMSARTAVLRCCPARWRAVDLRKTPTDAPGAARPAAPQAPTQARKGINRRQRQTAAVTARRPSARPLSPRSSGDRTIVKRSSQRPCHWFSKAMA